MKPYEIGIIMDILEAAYPQFYKSQNDTDKKKAMALWAEMFRDDDVAIVAAAVKSLIETDEKGFPPHIGSVKAKIRLITGSDEMTELEAWNLVSKAIRNSGYEAKEEFDKLPANIRRLVGSPNQLREWAMMDADTVQSVIGSNFQRSYKVVAQREKEIAKLPTEVKNLIGNLAESKKMDAPKQKKELPDREPVALLEAVEMPKEEPKKVATGRSREEVLQMLRCGT